MIGSANLTPEPADCIIEDGDRMNKKRKSITLTFLAVLFLTMLACNLPGDNNASETNLVTVSPTIDIQKFIPTSTSEPSPIATEVPTEEIQRSGLYLAYTDSSRNLVLWSEDRAQVDISRTGDVLDAAISDDGQLIAYLRSSDEVNYGLWVSKTDGTDARQIITAEQFKAMKHEVDALSGKPAIFTWTPNKHEIAFTTSPVYDGPGLILNDDFWIYDLEDPSLTMLLQPGRGGLFYYSPNGEQIAIVRPDGVSLIKADGNNYRQNVFEYLPVMTYSEYEYYAVPKWSEDGSYIRMIIPPADALGQSNQKTMVWQIFVSDGTARKLSEFSVPPFASVDLSSNGDRIAYISEGSNNQNDLHIANFSGEDIIYQSGEVDFGGWGLTSSQFLIYRSSQPIMQIGKLNQDPQPLLDVGHAAFANWVDDTRFIFMERHSEGWHLRLAQTDGTSRALVNISGDSDSFYPIYSFVVVD
jgi:hypothetical protein